MPARRSKFGGKMSGSAAGSGRSWGWLQAFSWLQPWGSSPSWPASGESQRPNGATEANDRATAEAVAVQERQNALQQAAVLLAGQAETELADGYHDRAVLLALAALENYPYTPQAEHALGQAVSYSRALQQITAHQSALTSLAWSPDGKRVASSGSSDNNVHIWDPATGKTILVIDMPKGITGNKLDMALNVQWTPDGKRLLTLTGDRYTLGSQDYDLLLWDAASGELISSLEIANQAEPESGDMSNTFINYPTGTAAEIATTAAGGWRPWAATIPP